MSTVSLLPNGRQQFLDNNGNPLVGGTVGTYEQSTLTPKTTWSDSNGVTPNTNPIVLDSLGSAAIWGNGYYRQIVKNSSGSTVWDQDTLCPMLGGTGTTIFFDNLAALRAAQLTLSTSSVYVSGYSIPEDGGGAQYTRLIGTPGAGPGRVQSADGTWWIITSPFLTVEMFGAKGDGATDDRAAIQTAINFSNIYGVNIYCPSDAYLIGSTASSDALNNGLLFSWLGNFSVLGRRGLIGNGNTQFFAGANNMVICRVSNTYITLKGILFYGNGHTGVTGVGIWPENRTQTGTAVSQSHTTIQDCSFVGLSVGIGFQPGPTVGGSASGCFYPLLSNIVVDTCTTGFDFIKPADSGTNPNYVTRLASNQTAINNTTTGINADGFGDGTFTELTFEFCTTGVLVPDNSGAWTKVLRLVGGWAENCTHPITNNCQTADIERYGFTSTAPNGTFGTSTIAFGPDNTTLYAGVPGAIISSTIDTGGVYTRSLDQNSSITHPLYRWKIHNNEIMSLDDTGFLRVGDGLSESNNGHKFYINAVRGDSNPVIEALQANNTSPRGIKINYTGGAFNTAGAAAFITCLDTSANRFFVWSNGDCANTNNVYAAISDIKLKTNIEPARNYLDDLCKLELRKFNLISDPSGPKQLGLIAQEVEKIFPGLVYDSPDYETVATGEVDDNGDPVIEDQPTGSVTKHVKYSLINLMLLKAVQELSEEVQSLKASINKDQ